MKTLKHLFTALLLLCSSVAFAHDFEVDGIYYNITNSTTKEVAVTFSGIYFSTVSNEYTGDVVIPESVTYNGTTYSVTSIGSSAFEGCTGLTSVEIPNSVTSIGSSAFEGCSGLTSIEIPNSVTSIGSLVFYYCSGLTSIVIPNSVTSIERMAFYGCSGLTSIEILDGVTSIGEWAFANCSGLTSITIPNSVTSISSYAFNGCSSLTSIVIPNSVTSIEREAFYGSTGLTSVEIPNSVTSIGYAAFYNCSGLTSITIPNSVTSIENQAFNGCISLKDLRFEDGEGTLSIGAREEGFFYDCPLETLYLGRDLSYNTRYKSPFYNKTTLKNVIIGDNVTSIGYEVFRGCSGLTSITIPNSVTSIGSNAFAYCSGLTSVEFNAENCTAMHHYYLPFQGCTALSTVTIGENVKNIPDYAFVDRTGLTSIVIPNSVTSIGYRAFSGCTGLTSVVIGNSVTSIGGSAFRDCSGLTSVEIPDGVTSIGSDAFNGCTGLTGELVIPDGVTSIGSGAFYGCSGLTSVEIGNSVTSIGNNAFYGCSNLSGELVIPDAVTSIGNEAFSGCYNLSGELVIPDAVTSIGNYAFKDCSRLTALAIGSGVTIIGYYAFSGCSRLTGELVIPDSVTSIGKYAFEKCTGLTSVVIGNSVTNIGSRAFYSTGLKDVYISDIAAWCGIDFDDSDGNYGTNPLYYAKNLYLNGDLLTNVVIPEGVTEIKKYAFHNYDKLVNVTVPGSVTSIGSYAFNEADAVIDIAAVTPTALGSGVFTSNAVFVVPDAAVDAYKAAWSSYASRIAGRSDALVAVDVEANDATSAIMERIGLEKMASIAKLAVKGSINSYDVIQFRDKMPLLRELDLSEATVVASDKAFYNGNCTKDNDLGGYVFYGLSKLNNVKLPKDLVSIGNGMFYECSSLRELEIPETVTNIEGAAFSSCSSLKSIVIPKGVKSLPNPVLHGVGWSAPFGLFANCSALESVTLPDGLENISEDAFYNCKVLKDIKLPPTVKTIDEEAFYKCSALEEIRIPSSVQSIGENAFGGCNNLNKVYAYTVEPTVIKENTFSTFGTATLYVPSFSFSNYYWDDGWKRFLNLAEFNEPYEYFYVNNDYTLNDDTGYIEGTEGNAPDADINAGGGFIVEGEQGDEETPNQSLGDVNVGSNGEGTSGSIIGDNNLHIDDLHIRINVKGGRWYFFAFPFDIFFKDITMENGSDYVFRYYDGAERAQNGKGGWKDINENHLKAARGYIFQCSANDVLVLNIEDVKFKKEDKYNELVAHVSENLKDASWNFTGNPYLSYYDMADMDYTAPVTVWDGEKYVAIRPGDDDYHFAPYEAFFVQKPENQDNIPFDGEEQMTKNQSNKKKEKQAAARRARGIDPERLLINLVLANGTSDDRTRIVFNERQSLAYETACDATKFETAGVAQLYTIGSDKVHYAINERPADNGRVTLGYTAPVAGFYTIEAQRMDAEVYVKDFKTGTLHNLKDGAYSFGTDAGTFNDRFEILLGGTAPGTTGIDEVKGENGEVKTEIYDLQGRKIQDAGKGIYIIDGEKVVK